MYEEVRAMDTLNIFLIHYGLIAIFALLLIKSIGVPIPLPADVIILTAAAWAAAGQLVLWQVVVAILLALVLGGMVQYLLARAAGRKLLYRFGRYLGLTPVRLDAASAKVKKGGVLAIGLSILVPGVRGAAIVASGLADVPASIFLSGLTLGSIVFLALHVFLGFVGGSLFATIGKILPSAGIALVVLALLVVVFALWYVAYHRQQVARQELDAASLEVWHEGICPACLALYTANQFRAIALETSH
jgi:membrane protein DedA with SNARE-associated domain